MGGASEEEGDYRVGGDPPWGVSDLSHILGAPALASNTGKTRPLGWLVGGLVGLTGELWEAWTPPLRSAQMLAFTRNRVERADGNCTGHWLVPVAASMCTPA